MKKFGFILGLFIFGLLFVNNTYALDDLSVTYSNGSNQVICAPPSEWGSSYTSCDGYNYVTITTDGLNSNAVLYFNSSFNPGTFNMGTVGTVSFNKSLSSTDYLRFYMQNYSSGSYTVTLSENPPSQDCPAPPPCPDCEDCDSPFIVELFKQGFWGIATALVGLIIPILALFLLFRLVHDLLFKGSL